jgi:hypothetical protein
MPFVCSSCGKTHDGLPDLAFDRPAYAQDVPEQEREKRVDLGSDLCVVDDEHYFIRGIIEIPIRGQEDYFGIGAWVSQKRENFLTYKENSGSSTIGPFFGWLSNDFMFGGERTLSLKTMAHFRGASARPRIVLEPTAHPLATAQREGLTLDEVWKFLHGALGDAVK